MVYCRIPIVDPLEQPTWASPTDETLTPNPRVAYPDLNGLPGRVPFEGRLKRSFRGPTGWGWVGPTRAEPKDSSHLKVAWERNTNSFPLGMETIFTGALAVTFRNCVPSQSFFHGSHENGTLNWNRRFPGFGNHHF